MRRVEYLIPEANFPFTADVRTFLFRGAKAREKAEELKMLGNRKT